TFQAGMDAWFTNNGGRTYANNADVLLADAFNMDNPNAMPMAGSPVWQGGGLPPNDGFFDPNANFVGAFGLEDWTAGWSSFNFQVPVPNAVEEEVQQVTDYTLTQNYPNPFNPSTNIRFALPIRSQVTLTIYNTLGQQVDVLVNKVMDAGWHTITWDAANLQSGTYIYRIKAGEKVFTKKMLLIK
ncbi:T9SS type A sorting domain-containing protein, partial [candidate division KSB1 bacterium]|nr:T9SS type A sorting domain-containing protein [candidate division KSB1 bacterium]